MNRKLDFSILKTAESYKVSFPDTSNINGDYVKRLREKLGLTQIVFSTIIGVKKRNVEKWELGVKAVPKTAALLMYLINNNDYVFKMLYNINKA